MIQLPVYFASAYELNKLAENNSSSHVMLASLVHFARSARAARGASFLEIVLS